VPYKADPLPAENSPADKGPYRVRLLPAVPRKKAN